MKAIIILLVILAIGIGLLYFKGGYSTFDPNEQGRKAKAAIKPGMPFKQVVSVAGPPKDNDYLLMVAETKKGSDGQPLDAIRPGPRNKYNATTLAARIANHELRDGFAFEYVFSQSIGFRVYFDGTGAVERVEDLLTMADLLGTK